MKKVFILIFMLGLLSLVYQFGVIYLIKEKNSSYVLTADGINFTVDESFEKVNSDDLYQFKIKNNNTEDTYVYSVNKDFNRQNKVVREIKRFEQNGLNCIVPVFKDGSIAEILCKSGNDIVSYSYLRQQGNNSVDSFISNLKAEGYSSTSFENGLEFEQKENVQVAINFPSEYGATIWALNKLYLIQKGQFKVVNLFDEKRVDNSLAVLVGKYYITVNTDDASRVPNFEKLYLINTETGLKDYIYVAEDEGGLSRNIYFAGIVGNKVYIVDKTNKREFEVNASTKSIKEVGNANLTVGKYYDGKELTNISINELTDKNYYFKDTVDIPELTEKYGNIEVRYSNKKYYFKTESGDIFYVLKSDLNHPVKLFNFSSFKEWKLKGDSIFGINGNTVYMYNYDYGLKPIIRDSDFVSYQNFYDIFKK